MPTVRVCLRNLYFLNAKQIQGFPVVTNRQIYQVSPCLSKCYFSNPNSVFFAHYDNTLSTTAKITIVTGQKQK